MTSKVSAARALIETRGMRAGRAIRRVAPALTDDVVGAIARVFGRVRISSEREQFMTAYEAVCSCMKGRGDALHTFYTRNGVEIAVATNGAGEIVARALVKGGRFYKAYGEGAFALEAWLEFAGFEQTPDWLGAEPLVNPGARLVRKVERVVTQQQRSLYLGAAGYFVSPEASRETERLAEEYRAQGAWVYYNAGGMHACFTARTRAIEYATVEGGVEVPYIDGNRPEIIPEEA